MNVHVIGGSSCAIWLQFPTHHGHICRERTERAVENRESSGHGHRYHLGAWKIEKTRVGVKYVQEGQYGVFHINHKYP